MVNVIDKIMNNQQLKDHWFRRGVAYIIDSLIIFFVTLTLFVFVVTTVIMLTTGGAIYGDPVSGLAAGFLILIMFVLIIFFFSIAYWVVFDAKGGTPGKRVMKLRPVALSGRMDYSKAIIRNLSKIVGGFIGTWGGNIAGGIITSVLVEWVIVGLDAYIGINRGEDPRRKFTDFMAETTVERTDLTESFGTFAEPIPSVSDALKTHKIPDEQSGSSTALQMNTPESSVVNTKSEYQLLLVDLRDSFLLGEISEEEYWKERKRITDTG